MRSEAAGTGAPAHWPTGSRLSKPVSPHARGHRPLQPGGRAAGRRLRSGQIGLDPASRQLVAGGTAVEAERVLENLKAVLAAAGLGFEHVVKVTIYLVDLADFATVNDIYGRYVRSALPRPRHASASPRCRAAPRVEIDAGSGQKQRR